MSGTALGTNHHPLTIPAITVVLLLFAVSAYGTDFKTDFKMDEKISISNLHVIDDDLYVAGNVLEIDGSVDGDLTAMVYKSTIRGRVSGTSSIFSRFLNHQGAIDGSLRAVSQNLVIDGIIGRSAELAGQVIKLGPGSTIQRDLNAQASQIHLDGHIGGKVSIHADEVIITGQIEQDVRITADQITVSPSAVINGNLTFFSGSEDNLEVASGADIHGETIWHKSEQADESSATETVMNVSGMLAAFLFGILIIRFFRPQAEESFVQLQRHSVTAFAAGLTGLVVVGLCLAVLIFSLLSLVTGVGILYSDTPNVLGMVFLIFSTLAFPISTFLGVTGGIVFYCGIILVSFFLGSLIVGLVRKKHRALSGLSLFVGLLALLLLSLIPYVGSWLYPLSAIAGGGAILMGIRRNRGIAATKSREEENVEKAAAAPNPPTGGSELFS